LSFAIPSNVAEAVVQRLIGTGDARPSFPGIQYQELNPQLVNEHQVTISQGALLEEVVAGSPAAQAGLQVGDVIMAINGQPLDERHPLVSLLLEHIAEATITLEVMRNGQTFQLLDGYVATVDWPASIFWRDLSEANPDALVRLSVRDTAEDGGAAWRR
jgi:S1-C subfamily serine protease